MDGKEPATKDCPELLTLKEAAKLLGVSPRWLQDRAEDYGAIKVCRNLKFFKDIVGKTVGEIIGLLSAHLLKEWQEHEATEQAAFKVYLASERAKRKEERANRILNAECQRAVLFLAQQRKAQCEAPTRDGTPCKLPVVKKDTGTGVAGAEKPRFNYTNFRRCWQHQGVHPDVKCSPLPQTPRPKRSNWTTEMKAAASERAWKGNRDYQERLRRELSGRKTETGKEPV